MAESDVEVVVVVVVVSDSVVILNVAETHHIVSILDTKVS